MISLISSQPQKRNRGTLFPASCTNCRLGQVRMTPDYRQAPSNISELPVGIVLARAVIVERGLKKVAFLRDGERLS